MVGAVRVCYSLVIRVEFLCLCANYVYAPVFRSLYMSCGVATPARPVIGLLPRNNALSHHH